MPGWTQTPKTVAAWVPDIPGGPHIPDPFTLRSEIADFGFHPNRLFAAIARCNLTGAVSAAIASAEAQAAAGWLLAHVDDAPEALELLPSVHQIKDFMKAGRAGQLAAGLAYLYMQARGYLWSMHWEDAPVKPQPRYPTQKRPDFIFLGDTEADWVLMESKGTLSASAVELIARTDTGYTDQVDPYVGSIIPTGTVSHGFALGLHATPPHRSMMAVVRTAMPVDIDAERPSSNPALESTDLIRSCYRPSFGLMGLVEATRAIDDRRPLREALELIEVTIRERGFLVNLGIFPPGEFGVPERFITPYFPFVGAFGLEKSIGVEIISALRKPVSSWLEKPIKPITLDDIEGGWPEEIPMFADGLAWISDKYLRDGNPRPIKL